MQPCRWAANVGCRGRNLDPIQTGRVGHDTRRRQASCPDRHARGNAGFRRPEYTTVAVAALLPGPMIASIFAVITRAGGLAVRHSAGQSGAGVGMVKAAPKHHVRQQRSDHHVTDCAVHRRSRLEDYTKTQSICYHPRLHMGNPVHWGGLTAGCGPHWHRRLHRPAHTGGFNRYQGWRPWSADR